MTPNVPNPTTPAVKSDFEIAVDTLLNRKNYVDGKVSLDLGTYPLEEGEGASLYDILQRAKDGSGISEHASQYLVTTLRQYSSHLENVVKLPSSPLRDASQIQGAINTICITLTQIDPLTIRAVDAFEIG